MTRATARKRLGFRRELLLAEIARRCRECDAQARVYHGFECARCEAWNDDALAERDIPDWWEGKGREP